MGCCKRFRRALRRTAKAVIHAPGKVLRNARDVVTGEKSPEDALKDTLRVPVKAFKSAAEAIAAADVLAQQLTQKLAKQLGGSSAETLVADLNRLARLPADPALTVAALESVDKFIETGDVEYLNPINVYVLREINTTRDLLWDLARPVPVAALDELPDEVDALADGVRWVSKSDLPGNLSWPSIAFRHSKTRAIVFLDLIVFRDVPTSSGCDLALWAHELFHVKQFRAGGAAFTKRYMANEMGFRAVGESENIVEVEADLFACRFYPGCPAVYLREQRCPT